MKERHSLSFPTEIGSLKIEIENDLDIFKDQKLISTDHYYLQKIKEIKTELIRLSEEKNGMISFGKKSNSKFLLELKYFYIKKMMIIWHRLFHQKSGIMILFLLVNSY